jgi:hypothetical protein
VPLPPLSAIRRHGSSAGARCGGAHDRLFIDLPASADSLTVTAAGLDAQHNDQLTLALKRLDFGAALADPPFAASPAGAAVVATDSGGGGAGPSVTVSGSALQAGRWYAVLSNGNDVPVGARFAPRSPSTAPGPQSTAACGSRVHGPGWDRGTSTTGAATTAP